MGQLNVNSIRNKSDSLKFVIDNKIDLFLTSETKLDDSFPRTPYRHERNSKGGGLLLYI